MSPLPHSLDHIRQVLAEYFADKPVRRVQVFGSYARGEATAESDLDLLLEMVYYEGWGYFHYADDLGEKLGIKVDIGTTVSDYMMRYIKKDLITLYDAEQRTPRDPERVLHMLQAARNIELFLQGKTFADLTSDLLLQSGVERQFEILGEAASHVSVATQQLWPSVDWQGTKDFRNLIAHEYFRVDLAKLWQVSQHIVPGLRLVLEDLFADLDRQFGPDANV